MQYAGPYQMTGQEESYAVAQLTIADFDLD